MKCGSTSGSRKRLRSNLWIVYEGSHVKKQMKFGGRNRNTGYQQRRIHIEYIVLYFYNPFLIIENM